MAYQNAFQIFMSEEMSSELRDIFDICEIWVKRLGGYNEKLTWMKDDGGTAYHCLLSWDSVPQIRIAYAVGRRRGHMQYAEDGHERLKGAIEALMQKHELRVTEWLSPELDGEVDKGRRWLEFKFDSVSD